MTISALPTGPHPAFDLAEFACPHCGDVAAMTRTTAPPLPKPAEGEWTGFGFTTCASCGASAGWATRLGYTDEGVGIVDPSSAILVYPR
jgi:predicted RNA-binding Zn-ribbon protein involved in translation (DUF1610 family)